MEITFTLASCSWLLRFFTRPWARGGVGLSGRNGSCWRCAKYHETNRVGPQPSGSDHRHCSLFPCRIFFLVSSVAVCDRLDSPGFYRRRHHITWTLVQSLRRDHLAAIRWAPRISHPRGRSNSSQTRSPDRCDCLRRSDWSALRADRHRRRDFLSPLLIFTRWAETRDTGGVSAAFILVNSAAGLVAI